jgi:choline dehydrogenase-like flavoprotein
MTASTNGILEPFPSDMLNPEAIAWDAVIVGTGMGGATLGYSLAKAGWRVLFVERGRDLRSHELEPIRSRFVEDDPHFRRLPREEQDRRMSLGGRSTDDIEDAAPALGSPATFRPFIGTGTGGSSALFGMVLERFFPVDFGRGSAPKGTRSDRSAEWPIGYDDLRPWYERAEALYRVRGGADPLRPAESGALLPPQRLSNSGAAVCDALQANGMHPYQLHTACELRNGCATCQGFLCGAHCKNDAATICLDPAVTEHAATLLTDCAALAIEADKARVRQLVCWWRGRRIMLRSRVFALAAGALLTPALLLNSKSSAWPHGLANQSGLVGRNLMRHAIDLYVLTSAPSVPPDAFTKEVGFNDLYVSESEKLGAVQSFGVAMPLDYLRSRPGLSLWRMLGPLASPLWARYARQPILGAILEDDPSADNRVEPRGDVSEAGRYRLSINYRLGSGDRARRQRFRSRLMEVLKPLEPMRVRGSTDRPALGHACGTCRFGTDPGTSVLNPWNRTHALDNLYVVDASFFPTSGGINPALTIAANALRVAYHLESTMTPGRQES